MVESSAVVPVIVVKVASGGRGVWSGVSVVTDRNVLIDAQESGGWCISDG